MRWRWCMTARSPVAPLGQLPPHQGGEHHAAAQSHRERRRQQRSEIRCGQQVHPLPLCKGHRGGQGAAGECLGESGPCPATRPGGVVGTQPAYCGRCTLGADSSQQGAYFMDVNKLLDKAKIVRSISTDADLAKALGVSKQALSGWRNGARLPDAVACAALAGLSGEPLARVLGIVGEARAISREEKAVWHKLAASVAAVILLAVAIPLPARSADGPQERAQGHQLGYFAEYSRGIHIM